VSRPCIYTSPANSTQIAIAKMVSALLSGPQTVEELIAVSGLQQVTLRGYLKAMRREKIIRIADWGFDPRGAQTVPYYAFGSEADAKKRVMLRDQSKRGRQYRDRIKQQALMQLWAPTSLERQAA
jgi:hypothetical protein